jgi:hypothetical protein
VGGERLYTTATIVLWSATTTVTSGPVEPAELSDPPIWTFFLLLGLMVVPTAHAFAIRGRVFEPSRSSLRLWLPSKPGNGGRRRGRSRLAMSTWPVSFGSAVPTCQDSSTTAGWSI